jgi:hypothetical protein
VSPAFDISRVDFCACGELAIGERCWWPVDRYVIARVDDVRHGDFVRPAVMFTSAWERKTARVHQITAIADGKLELTVIEKNDNGAQHVERYLSREAEPIAIRRSRPCGAAVCDLHGRDPGDSRRVCQDHAMSWKDVA